jgi:hypothetical protein
MTTVGDPDPRAPHVQSASPLDLDDAGELSFGTRRLSPFATVATASSKRQDDEYHKQPETKDTAHK